MKAVLKPVAFAMAVSALCAGPAAAQPCSVVWEQARDVISADCNDAIRSNTLCYAHETLRIEPSSHYGGSFDEEGETVDITRDLDSIAANPDFGLGGFSFLKVIAGRDVSGLPVGQAVVMIAFGDTGLVQIESHAEPVDLDVRGQCEVRLRRGSTTFGGSYIRAMPDPGFQFECASYPCPDKNNLLYFVEEGEELSVLGRSADARTLLVHNRHATGWITAASRYMDHSDCSMGALPVFHDRIVQEALDTLVWLPKVSEFRLFNTPTNESVQCLAQDRPPGGLLILNASHQNVHFSVNSISISIASAVLITHHEPLTRIYVLQGRATVTPSGGAAVAAVQGQVVGVVSGAQATLLTDGAAQRNWCRALAELAQSAYRDTLFRFPEERLDFCGYARGGYAWTSPVLKRLLAERGYADVDLERPRQSDVDRPNPPGLGDGGSSLPRVQ